MRRRRSTRKVRKSEKRGYFNKFPSSKGKSAVETITYGGKDFHDIKSIV